MWSQENVQEVCFCDAQVGLIWTFIPHHCFQLFYRSCWEVWCLFNAYCFIIKKNSMWFNVVKITLANFIIDIIPLQWYVPVPCTVTLCAFIVRFACLLLPDEALTCWSRASWPQAFVVQMRLDLKVILWYWYLNGNINMQWETKTPTNNAVKWFTNIVAVLALKILFC